MDSKNGKNNKRKILLNGAEVCKIFGMGNTTGYAYLKHLEEQNILLPVKLPGLKNNRWNREDVIALCENKKVIPCASFKAPS